MNQGQKCVQSVLLRRHRTVYQLRRRPLRQERDILFDGPIFEVFGVVLAGLLLEESSEAAERRVRTADWRSFFGG